MGSDGTRTWYWTCLLGHYHQWGDCWTFQAQIEPFRNKKKNIEEFKRGTGELCCKIRLEVTLSEK